GRRLQSVGPVGEYTVSIFEVDAARPALAHGFLQREAAERLADAIGELALPVRIQQQQSRRRVSQGSTAAFFALAQFALFLAPLGGAVECECGADRPAPRVVQRQGGAFDRRR